MSAEDTEPTHTRAAQRAAGGDGRHTAPETSSARRVHQPPAWPSAGPSCCPPPSSLTTTAAAASSVGLARLCVSAPHPPDNLLPQGVAGCCDGCGRDVCADSRASAVRSVCSHVHPAGQVVSGGWDLSIAWGLARCVRPVAAAMAPPTARLSTHRPATRALRQWWLQRMGNV